jgi:predicted DCC family thiol-disulfide oxidoreductase YuxK
MVETDVMLLDGDCGLCTHVAVFLHPRLVDKSSIRFLAIESEEGQSLIATFTDKFQQANSVYLIRNGKPYMRSAAGIRAILYLKWYYRMWYPLLWLIPLPIRNIGYRIIARYRHKIFKRPSICIYPTLLP